jgi:hypothetical protein
MGGGVTLPLALCAGGAVKAVIAKNITIASASTETVLFIFISDFSKQS